MKKTIIIAAVLVIAGALILGGALIAASSGLGNLSTNVLKTTTREFDMDFDRISVNVKTADVTFIPTNREKCRVELVEDERLTHSVNVEAGTLLINVTDNRKWYDYIGIIFKSPSITVYLPKDEYTSLSVKTTTGNIEVPDSFGFDSVLVKGTTSNITMNARVSDTVKLETTTGSIIVSSGDTSTLTANATTGDITVSTVDARTVKLSATTGSVTMKDSTCNMLTVKNATGQINLAGVIATSSIDAVNSTGGVKLDGCDAREITVKTSTGSVTGTLLSEKIFVTETDTGRVEVPHSTVGGICEITTDTGSIKIEIE